MGFQVLVPQALEKPAATTKRVCVCVCVCEHFADFNGHYSIEIFVTSSRTGALFLHNANCVASSYYIENATSKNPEVST